MRFASLYLAFSLSACSSQQAYDGAFEMPTAAAILQSPKSPDEGWAEVRGGPFDEPVALVANGEGGRIVQLFLKQARFVTDDPTASFLRTNPLPTGGERLLSGVAPLTTDKTVTALATDKAFKQLLIVPWIIDIKDGKPVESDVSVSKPTFTGSKLSLQEVEIKKGYTTTETFTGTFDGEFWWIEGSRSGLQTQRPVADERFEADERRIAFDIVGDAKAGDQFQISTDSGLTEIDLPGTPIRMLMLPDQSRAAILIAEDGETSLYWYDTTTQALSLQPLPDGARPDRLSLSLDGLRLYVADSALPAAYEITDTTVVEHPMPWPLSDVAFLETEVGPRLYVVPVDNSSAWIYDITTQSLIDVNTSVDGVQGMAFETPVMGLESIPMTHLRPEYGLDGIRQSGTSVALSLAAGRVVFLDPITGCLIQNAQGPAAVADGSFGNLIDYSTNFRGTTGFPYLQTNGSNSQHVSVNQCAGIAKGETWKLTYDTNLTGWIVRGTLSGVQENIVFEDQRYLSDDGAVSLLIRAGSAPSQDGMQISFIVNEGSASADGDRDGDGIREFDIGTPSDLTRFWYPVGGDQGGWKQVDYRPFVLVLGRGTAQVARVDPQEADLEGGWF